MEEDDLDIPGIPDRLNDMGVTLGEDGVEFSRELTPEELTWLLVTALEMIRINAEAEGEEDPTLELDPQAGLLMSQALYQLEADPSMANFLAFIARRNLSLQERHEEPLYFRALGTELLTKWRDVGAYADGVAQQGGFDETYHPDVITLLNQILGEHQRALKLDLDDVHLELLDLAGLILEEAAILAEMRCMQNLKFVVTEVLPNLIEIVNHVLDNLGNEVYPHKPITLYRLLHARANLSLTLGHKFWPRLDKPGTTPEELEVLTEVREWDDENEESARVLVHSAYDDLIIAANTAHLELDMPAWKAKAELELTRLWIDFHDLGIEEYARLPNMEEHLGRARDLYDRLNFEEGVQWCDLLWADHQGDLETVTRIQRKVTPLSRFILFG